MKKQSNLSRLMGYAGKHRYLTYASWVLSGISALMALVPYLYIWKIINEVIQVAPDFGKAQDVTYNGWAAVGFAVLAVLVYIAGLMCSHISAFRIAANIRIDAMHHIADLPVAAIENFGSGKLRKTVIDSSAATEIYLAHQLPDKVGALITPIGLIVMLLFFDWRLGLLSLVPVACGFAVMTSMTGKGMAEKMKQYKDALDDMSNEAVEYVRGVPVVKTFGQTVFSFKRFKDSIDRYSTWAIAYTKQLRMPMMWYTLAINCVFVMLIGAGIAFSVNGVSKEFLLNLIFYIIITPIISVTLTKIMFMSENEMIVADAMTRIDSILDLQPLPIERRTMKSGNSIKDKNSYAAEIEAMNSEMYAPNSVVLEDVTFSYDGQKNVLEHVSLTVNPGETVALVGPSGGGKSTLAELISRFMDPDRGRILIGGADVRSIPEHELMNKISFVFQDSRLIKTSILENVRMGRPDASRDEVLRALDAAQCTDIIEKFPEGVDTLIGSKGVYLSGGEQQRIAIARAMLKDAPILILDEATAFADPDNESRVQAAFSELSKGKTVIMIAHRLSTVVNADQIFVMKDGRIREHGTCAELIEKKGLFAGMWANYQSAAKWKVGAEANDCIQSADGRVAGANVDADANTGKEA